MIPKPKSRPRSTRPGRITGAALEALRRACFERDGYRCQHDIKPPILVLGYFNHIYRCLKPVVWESGYHNSGHMAHIKARSLGGKDEIDNVILKCGDCHIGREHTMGEGKRGPLVPRKDASE